MNPVFWFEIPAKDRKKVGDFYAKAFGWKIIPLDAKAGEYTVVHTSETDADGMPKENNRINGGIFKLTDENKECANTPNIVVATGDINKTVNDIKAAGGTILKGPYEIPGYGTYVLFEDTEGTRGAAMQPKMP
ncbi:MAG TPA: VOC family protein [Candidatus Paceibacterota bacterium]|nr:VOC family protein [Candidatus Paceibacterota bacterium]